MEVMCFGINGFRSGSWHKGGVVFFEEERGTLGFTANFVHGGSFIYAAVLSMAQNT